MEKETPFTLINQQNGQLAFKTFSFTDISHFDHLQTNNFYSIIWVKQGTGLLTADSATHSFSAHCILAFAPYQPFVISSNQELTGTALQFHSDFYCIHRNPSETNCDTILFNNIYQQPLFQIDAISAALLNNIFDQFKLEWQEKDQHQFELLVPILKILLVTLTRIKSKAVEVVPAFTEATTPFVLQQLKTAIEQYYREKHTASDYARLLNISANALAKLCRTHFNKTITDLITDRIVTEAKRTLYMTSKPIKEIAWNLGFADEYYFSRVFKNRTAISPQFYRDTVGFAKSEEK
jgi:AraC-like DNA-binding protein